MERKVVEAQGGTAGADAKTADKATTWLNGNSAGTGAYQVAAWERNSQIQLVRMNITGAASCRMRAS